MTKVFIAGSRRLSRLNADVKRRIDTMIETGFTILVGDAEPAAAKHAGRRPNRNPAHLRREPGPFFSRRLRSSPLMPPHDLWTHTRRLCYVPKNERLTGNAFLSVPNVRIS